MNIRETVAAIIDDVRVEGNAALARYTKEFDNTVVPQLVIDRTEMARYWELCSAETRAALRVAYEQIRAFHSCQTMPTSAFVANGVAITERAVPIRRVGVYVPGGRYAYPSTALMTLVPAVLAGVDEVVLCTPPNESGLPNPDTVAAAYLGGATEIVVAGGAQAIAALAYGTESIERADFIAGPGNGYVNEAKRQVFGDVGIDALAGPSEVVILFDDETKYDLALAAARAQCEHGPDSNAVVLDLTGTFISEPKIVVEQPASVVSAIACINELAAEHVEIYATSAEELATQVTNAGAIFCNTSAVLGDYVAGTNHVLPTAGAARYSNGLRVSTFVKTIPMVMGSGNNELLNAGMQIAEIEGLQAHKQVLRQLAFAHGDDQA